MKKEERSLTRFSVYLRGDELCPDHISSMVGFEATEGRRLGETWTTSGNNQVIEKTGHWIWTRRIQTNDLEAALAEFLKKLPEGLLFKELPGVEDAYLDVFVANAPDESGGGESTIVFDPHCLNRLATLALPLQVTFAVVED